MLEEHLSYVFLFSAQEIQNETLRFVHRFEGMGALFKSYGHQRGLERGLGHPTDRGRGGSVLCPASQNIKGMGNHPEQLLFRVFVHGASRGNEMATGPILTMVFRGKPPSVPIFMREKPPASC